MKVGARNANIGRWPQKEPLREGARPKGPSPGSRGREEKPSQWGPLKMEEEEARDTEIFELEMKAEKLRDLLKKGENILSLEKFFFEFVETAATKISARMRLEDYRNCVYLGNVVQKITESVLMSFVSQKLHDEVYKDKKVLEIQNILGSISSVSRKPLVLSEYLKICYTGILNGKEFNPSRSFIEKTMVFLTLVLNNKAVMYFVRGQPMQGLIILLKTIQMRTRKCCSVVSCVQIAMMYINVAFLLTQVDKDEDALTFTNYSALLLEEMDPILQKEDTIDPFTKISMDYMHLLVRNFPDACGSLPHLERLTPSTVISSFFQLGSEASREEASSFTFWQSSTGA